VTAAARQPKINWRAAEYQRLRPLNSEDSMPTAHSTVPLASALAAIAQGPCIQKNGATGKIAPAENKANEVAAAVQALPPNSAGSMPNSLAGQRIECALLVLHHLRSDALSILFRHTLGLKDQGEFMLLG